MTTSMRIHGERSEEYEMKVGVHQDFVLSSILFAIMMDEMLVKMIWRNFFMLMICCCPEKAGKK